MGIRSHAQCVGGWGRGKRRGESGGERERETELWACSPVLYQAELSPKVHYISVSNFDHSVTWPHE